VGRSAFWEEDDRCLEWLERQAPGSVLYVSFGSLAVLTAEQFEELAVGLERSGYPFLWVMRRDLVSVQASALTSEDGSERVQGKIVEKGSTITRIDIIYIPTYIHTYI
jgi:hypothetical protein